MVLFRFIPALFLIPFFFAKKIEYKVDSPLLMLLRSLMGVMSIVCLFYSLKWGHFGKENLLYTLGTFWAFLWSVLILKEKPKAITISAIPLAFIGLICIFKPISGPLYMADVVALLGSFFTAFAYISIKKLRESHTAISIVFSFYMTGFIIFLLPTLKHFVLPSSKDILFSILIGVSGFIAQILMTIGYKYTPITVSSSIKLTSVVLMICIGIVLFNDTLDWVTGFGIGSVLTAIYVITRYQ